MLCRLASVQRTCMHEHTATSCRRNVGNLQLQMVIGLCAKDCHAPSVCVYVQRCASGASRSVSGRQNEKERAGEHYPEDWKDDDEARHVLNHNAHQDLQVDASNPARVGTTRRTEESLSRKRGARREQWTSSVWHNYVCINKNALQSEDNRIQHW